MNSQRSAVTHATKKWVIVTGFTPREACATPSAMRFPRAVGATLVLVGLSLLGVMPLSLRGASAAETLTPEQTLRRYLDALKTRDFAGAQPYVSKAMLGGKDKEVWVKEGEALVAMCDLKIFKFEIGTAKVDGDEAQVPNKLESQDKCINALGITEYELYTLVREDGVWKVDSQILLEPPQVPEWFPKAGGKTDTSARPGSGH